MKKFLLLFGIILCLASCANDEETPATRHWKIANYTEQSLTLRCPYSSSLYEKISYKTFIIAPQDTVTIYGGNARWMDVPDFDYYFKKSAKQFGQNVSWQLSNEQGDVLKTWIYSENDKFFDKSEWFWYSIPRAIWVKAYWTFTIEPSDIEQAK